MKQHDIALSILGRLAAACSKSAPPPSLAIINARVWTGDSATPRAEMLTVVGGKVVFERP